MMPAHLKEFLHSLTHPYPARDWFIALVVSFFLFFAFASYGMYLYTEVSSGDAFKTDEGASAPVITVSQNDIESLLTTYRSRITNWNAHNIPTPTVVDPH
jgi:hypothetical protein